MDNNELRDILNGYCCCNKASIVCFVGMLIALFKVRIINLTELACDSYARPTKSTLYNKLYLNIKKALVVI